MLAGKELNTSFIYLLPSINPLQYSCLENAMRGGTWRATYSPWGRKELDMTEQLTLLQELGIENPWTVAHQVPPSMRFFRQ